jgi:hypothetical protein
MKRLTAVMQIGESLIGCKLVFARYLFDQDVKTKITDLQNLT